MIIDEHAKIVLVTTSGESYTIPESGIVKNTLSTSHSCSNSGGIPAGSCNAGTLSVSIRRPYGLQYRSLFGAKLRLYVWYGSHSEEQRGVYTLTSVTRSGNVLNISASDNIQLLDSSCYGAQDVQDAINGLLAILGNGNHTPAYIFNTICNAYSIPHLTQAENIEIIPEAGNISPGNLSTTIPQESPTESIRDFAQALAEYVGGFICAYEDGRLGFCRLGARVSDIVLDNTNIGMGTFQRAPYFVLPDRWRVTFDSGFWSGWEVTSDLPEGAAPLTIEVQNNLFWQAIEDTTPGEFLAGKVTEMVKHPWQYLRDAAQKDGVYRIHPFSATVYVPHLFRAGDLVTIKDPETGEKFQSYITDVTWSFKRGQNISCAGSDTRTLSVQKSRNSAKKSNDYSKYLYRKTKSGSGGGDTVSITRYQTNGTKIATFTVSGTPYDVYAPSSPTAAQIQQWTAAAEKAHTHSNKAVLDDTTAAYTVEEKEKLAGLHGRYLPLAGGTMDVGAIIELPGEKKDTSGNGANYTEQSVYIGGNENDIQVIWSQSSNALLTYRTAILRSDGLHLNAAARGYVPSYTCGIWFEPDGYTNILLGGVHSDTQIGFYRIEDGSQAPLLTIGKHTGDIYISGDIHGAKNIYGEKFIGGNATQSTQGLMSATDKAKLDGIITKSATSSTHTNWHTSSDRAKLPDISFLSYWNGAYDSAGNSNLLYCKQGKFGTIVTKNAGDYLAADGTAVAAAKLATSRTITIGSKGKTFDGSANVSFTLAEIGAAAASHTHSQLHTHSTKTTNYGTLTASSNQISITSAVGMHTNGKSYSYDDKTYSGSGSAEIFNDYTKNQAGGDYAHVEGTENKGFANCCHVEGWNNVCTANQAHVGGEHCKATGEASFVHGVRCTATTKGSVAVGDSCTAANSNCAMAFGWGITNLISNSMVVGQWNNQTSPGLFAVGKGSSSTRANAFRVSSDGKTYATGAYSSTGADYAEMFEWLDGNPNEEDRRGRFVTLDGEKIKFAESIYDGIVGVVSAAASIIGDAYEDNWNKMYLTDVFGASLYDDPIIDEDGEVHVYQTVNPSYNPDAEYIPRSQRKEWDAVGMMGKLVVVDDGTCVPNSYCIPTISGIATRSEGRIGYRVLSRVDDTHIKILVR